MQTQPPPTPCISLPAALSVLRAPRGMLGRRRWRRARADTQQLVVPQLPPCLTLLKAPAGTGRNRTGASEADCVDVCCRHWSRLAIADGSTEAADTHVQRPPPLAPPQPPAFRGDALAAEAVPFLVIAPGQVGAFGWSASLADLARDARLQQPPPQPPPPMADEDAKAKTMPCLLDTRLSLGRGNTLVYASSLQTTASVSVCVSPLRSMPGAALRGPLALHGPCVRRYQRELLLLLRPHGDAPSSLAAAEQALASTAAYLERCYQETLRVQHEFASFCRSRGLVVFREAGVPLVPG